MITFVFFAASISPLIMIKVQSVIFYAIHASYSNNNLIHVNYTSVALCR